MPNNAFTWMQRVKAVEREYTAIRLAVDRLLQTLAVDPASLDREFARRDIGTASDRLEGTYVIRVFSEFETALQHFMRDLNMRRPGRAEVVVNRVRDRGRIPQSVVDRVHQVREYRNTLVHDRTEPVPPVTLREATSSVCTYLSHVRRIW